MADETYGEERARNLEALLRNLATRIGEMDARGELLKQAGELRSAHFARFLSGRVRIDADEAARDIREAHARLGLHACDKIRCRPAGARDDVP